MEEFLGDGAPFPLFGDVVGPAAELAAVMGVAEQEFNFVHKEVGTTPGDEVAGAAVGDGTTQSADIGGDGGSGAGGGFHGGESEAFVV